MNYNQVQLVSIVKDIFTIIFTGCATFLSYKTYKRAKKTLLQPMKSEVIKIQTDLFIKLLNFLYKDLLKKEIDMYEQIIFLNTYSYLIECGYAFANQNKIIEIIQTKSKISIIIPNKDDMCESIELIQTVEEELDIETNKKDIGKKKYEDLKNGLVHIEIFKLGDLYSEINDTLTEYINNPIMPQIIVDNLIIIDRIIHDNIIINLNETIKEYLIEFSKNNYKKIITPGIFNNFNRKREPVSNICDHVRTEIRKYLRVDEEWA